MKRSTGPWKAQILGKATSDLFEISVVNTPEMRREQEHYGWFDANKLLISHSGGHWSHWPTTKRVWDKLVKVAHELADELNQEALGPPSTKRVMW